MKAAEKTNVSPERFFETITAYQSCAALKAAIELGIFTAIGTESRAASEVASATGSSFRGTRILCDYLVVAGFLTKKGETYGLSAESALFLDQNSPAYLGTTIDFLTSDMLTDAFKGLTNSIRTGTTPLADEGTTSHENPIWVKFARSMAPMMQLPAQLMATALGVESPPSLRVLDIAAGHGIFGLTIACANPNATVVALDWPEVLNVAHENAEKLGVAERFSTIPGSAFDASFGTGYDLVLVTNFVHHFDRETNVSFYKKVHASLTPGGRCATLEFVPNEDRVSPPHSAMFSLVMLATTPAGDAYTFSELESILREAGFETNKLLNLEPSIEQLVVSSRT